MKEKYIALILLDLAIWLIYTLIGVRAQIQGTCVDDLAFYVTMVGTFNILFALYRAVACGIAILISGVVQIFANVVSLLYGFVHFSPYFTQESFASSFSCDARTVTTTFMFLVTQAVVVVGGYFLLQNFARRDGSCSRPKPESRPQTIA